MNVNRLWVSTTLLAHVASAYACGICNANISYNYLPFTAAWVIIFCVWLAILGLVYSTEKRRGADVSTLRIAVKGAVKYLVVLLVLYLFGLHLVAILILPLFLLLSWKRLKAFQTLSALSIGALVALVVVVPASYAAFPKIASEPETRVAVTKYKKEMRGLLPRRGAAGVHSNYEDPFAYTMFDVPVLNVITQGFGTFYRRLPQPANQVRLMRSESLGVVWSRGPDGTYSMSEAALTDAMQKETSQTAVTTITYDPTNGILSQGDIILAGRVSGTK